MEKIVKPTKAQAKVIRDAIRAAIERENKMQARGALIKEGDFDLMVKRSEESKKRAEMKRALLRAA